MKKAARLAALILIGAVLVCLAACSHAPADSLTEPGPATAEIFGEPPERLRLAGEGALRRHTAVPILMYHEIDQPRGPWVELFVDPEDFRRHMEFLLREGYTPVTVDRLARHWRQGLSLPGKPVAVTFDDGYRGVYEHAFPVMEELAMVGTVYAVEQLVGRDNFVTGDMLREMAAAGFEIGAHTRTHPDLTRVSDRRLLDEVTGCRRRLAEQYSVPVTTFAYPAGGWDARVLAAVREAGYLAAVTTRYGSASPEQGLFTLHRVRINRSDGLAGFRAKLRQLESR